MPNKENTNQYTRGAKPAENEIDTLLRRVKRGSREIFIGFCESVKLKNISKKEISESRGYDYSVFAISAWGKEDRINKN